MYNVYLGHIAAESKGELIYFFNLYPRKCDIFGLQNGHFDTVECGTFCHTIGCITGLKKR